MTHIIVPEHKRLVWYLAAEEYLGRTLKEPVFFTWIVDPTVIFGRHQVMEQEVNMEYCREHGVNMYRRKSGGGCVYADRGNIMLSYLDTNTRSEQVFQEYLDKVSKALRGLGFVAVKSEHNDVMIDGKKVSGNACYALPTGTIVHGTMLYNVDFAALQQAITPSVQKMAKHGVQSVRQRVVNLKDEGCPIDLPEKLAAYFEKELCDSERRLTDEEMAEIDAIEATYLDPKFIHPESAPKYQLVIFDLDGTILNTIADLSDACNHALAVFGFPTHSLEENRSMVGNGINKLLERAMPATLKTDEATTKEWVTKLREVFVEYYGSHCCDKTEPYPGMPELLLRLKQAGVRLAVASNKYDEATQKIVEHYYPGVFDMVIGERSGMPRKPETVMIDTIVNTLHHSAQISDGAKVLYVGDSLVDIVTARNAGLTVAACTYGFVDRQAVADAKPDMLIDKPEDLMSVLY